MNYDEAHKLAFAVPWKTSLCSDEKCWCRIIEPEQPIFYTYDHSPDKEWAFSVVDAGAIDKEIAEYIVRLHNTYLNNKVVVANISQESKDKLKEIFKENGGQVISADDLNESPSVSYYDEFLNKVYDTYDKHLYTPNKWRMGQTIMNVLYEVWPKKWFEISGTDIDCFYDDKNIVKVTDTLAKGWPK